MTAQQHRQEKADLVVEQWLRRGFTTGRAVQQLNRYAARAEHLDFVPHLVTACTRAGLLGARRRVA